MSGRGANLTRSPLPPTFPRPEAESGAPASGNKGPTGPECGHSVTASRTKRSADCPESDRHWTAQRTNLKTRGSVGGKPRQNRVCVHKWAASRSKSAHFRDTTPRRGRRSRPDRTPVSPNGPVGGPLWAASRSLLPGQPPEPQRRGQRNKNPAARRGSRGSSVVDGADGGEPVGKRRQGAQRPRECRRKDLQLVSPSACRRPSLECVRNIVYWESGSSLTRSPT